MSSPYTKHRNNAITSLRGIFIIMIVLHHLGLYSGGGTLGVAFFFMLGGLTLSLGYYERVCRPDFEYSQYIRRRCEKFFPLHWLCLLAIMPLSLLPIIRGIVDVKTAVAAFIPNVLLLQSLIPIKSIYFSYNAVSWYLSSAMILALLYPFIVKSLDRLSYKGKAITFILMLSAYSTLVCLLPVEHRHAILYINPLVRVVDFTIGIYLYLLYRATTAGRQVQQPTRKKCLEAISIAMIVIAVLTSVVLSKDTRRITAVYWLPISVILMSSIVTDRVEGRLNRLLEWIGEKSLPIFMTHQIVITYVEAVCGYIGLNTAVAKTIISIPLILLTAWLCDKYFLGNFPRIRHTKGVTRP